MIDRLKTLRKSITTVQREGQAPRPTKSGWGSSNAKTYKHTQTLALRKASGIVRFWKGWCGARGLSSFCNGCGARDVVLLRWLWEWQCSVQREEQARSPTKSGWDSADAKQAERSLKGKGGGAK